jgi:hypothetical protein
VKVLKGCWMKFEKTKAKVRKGIEQKWARWRYLQNLDQLRDCMNEIIAPFSLYHKLRGGDISNCTHKLYAIPGWAPSRSL